jgi:hypothetical protein
MTAYVADMLALIQRLVAVIKMATVLEEFVTQEQRSLVRFLWAKDSMQMIFIKKCFLFTVGSVCCVKLFIAGSRNSLNEFRKSQMTPGQVALLRLRQKQLCSGWNG